MISVLHEIDFRKRVSRLGWTLVIMIGLMNVLGLIHGLIYTGILSTGSESLMVSIGTLFEAGFYVSYFLIPSLLFYVMSGKISTKPVKFKVKLHKYLPLMILSGIGITFAASQLNYYFCDLFGYCSDVGQDYSQYLNDPEIIAWFMTTSLAPAFAEELLFRGVLYSNLRTYGKTFAVLTSAVAFALMHQNVEQFFYTMVAGIVLALIYEATDSIWGGVFLHMFNNFYSVFSNTILYRFDETSAYVILSLTQAALIFAGVVSTICLVLIQRKHERLKDICPDEPEKGFYGENRTTVNEAYDIPIPLGQAFKTIISTPSVIVYIVLAVGSAILNIWI